VSCGAGLCARLPQLKRRKLNLKAKIESGVSYFSFKSLIPGAFNVTLIGSACTALPSAAAARHAAAFAGSPPVPSRTSRKRFVKATS